jgi:hypothetical protein
MVVRCSVADSENNAGHVLEGKSSLLGRPNSWRLLARLYIDESSILPLSYRPPARKLDKIPVKKNENRWRSVKKSISGKISRETPEIHCRGSHHLPINFLPDHWEDVQS